MGLVIRMANMDDLDNVVELWKKLSVDQMSQIKYYKDQLVFEGGHMQFTQALSNENCSIFLAVLDGKTVGFIETWLYEKDFNFFIDDYAYIMHCFVDESVRKDTRIYAIINQMYQHSKQWSISKGRRYLVADAFSFNNRIMQYLKRAGFEEFRIKYVKEL